MESPGGTRVHVVRQNILYDQQSLYRIEGGLRQEVDESQALHGAAHCDKDQQTPGWR